MNWATTRARTFNPMRGEEVLLRVWRFLYWVSGGLEFHRNNATFLCHTRYTAHPKTKVQSSAAGLAVASSKRKRHPSQIL